MAYPRLKPAALDNTRKYLHTTVSILFAICREIGLIIKTDIDTKNKEKNELRIDFYFICEIFLRFDWQVKPV